MVTIEKPKSVTITIRDRRENASKSITVYDTNLNEVYGKVWKCLK